MTKVIYESLASKGKRIVAALKPKIKNLNKDEIGDYLQALDDRLTDLENKS